MGKVLQLTPPANGKVKCTISLDPDEVAALQGHFKDIHVIPLDSPKYHAEVLETGIKGSTKYFRIPPEVALRSSRGRRRRYTTLSLSCQYAEMQGKGLFIYVIPKENGNGEKGIFLKL